VFALTEIKGFALARHSEHEFVEITEAIGPSEIPTPTRDRYDVILRFSREYREDTAVYQS